MVICKNCKMTTKGADTTSLFDHLHQKHLVEYKENSTATASSRPSRQTTVTQHRVVKSSSQKYPETLWYCFWATSLAPTLHHTLVRVVSTRIWPFIGCLWLSKAICAPVFARCFPSSLFLQSIARPLLSLTHWLPLRWTTGDLVSRYQSAQPAAFWWLWS